MEALVSLAVKAIFVENLALSFFLGMCTFIAVSKKISTAIGLGISVMIVQSITVPANNVILSYLLKPGALAWAGFPDVDLTFLGLISYIAVEKLTSNQIANSYPVWPNSESKSAPVDHCTESFE